MANNLNSNYNINNNTNNNVNSNNYNTCHNFIINNNLSILNHFSNENHFEAFTTYKIICLELISIFCNIKKNKIKYSVSKNAIINENILDSSTANILQLKDYCISSYEEMKLLNLILRAIKTVDMQLESIIQTAIDLNIKVFNDLFFNRIDTLIKHTIIDIKNLVNDLKIYFIVQPTNDPLIRPWSILGRYVRRCIIIFEKTSFDKVVTLSKQTSSFLKQIRIKKALIFNENSLMEFNFNESNLTIASNSFHKNNEDNNLVEMDLDGSIISVIGEPDTCSSTVKLKHQYSIFPTKAVITVDDSNKQIASAKINSQFCKTNLLDNNYKKNDFKKKNYSILNALNGCALSRKTAEFFVSQQAYLIEHNEYESMLPIDLHQKIDELFCSDPRFFEVFYLKYLNVLRIKDYTISLKYLHDYFDRFIANGSISLAALNLVSLEYRFSNRENAIFALKEAITSAHQDGDNICLQHCLSWMYKLFQNDFHRKNFLIKNSCCRAINYDLTNLASYNLHFFSRNNTETQKPNLILDLLNKTDIINLKMNSKTELALINRCHKSSIWSLYGNRKISNLYTQLLLNQYPKSGSYKLNTESQCIGISSISSDFAKTGLYRGSQSILDFCKLYHSSFTKQSKNWMLTEYMILFESSLLMGKWSDTYIYLGKLASCDTQRALLEEMNMLVMDLNLDKAKELGKRILSNKVRTVIEPTSSTNIINLKLNHINISLVLKEFSKALVSVIKLFSEIKNLEYNYELMNCCLLISKILINMEYPEQAIKYLKKCIIYINSYGTLIDQCKHHFFYARCLHMLNKKHLKTSIKHMYQCVEKLEKIQASIYLKSAYSYLSLLLNESGNFEERNKFALKFRNICSQNPLIGLLL